MPQFKCEVTVLSSNRLIVKEYWIDIPSDSKQQAAALEKAKHINVVVFNKSHNDNIFGFAKAVCLLVKKKGITQWKVRVLKAEFNASEKMPLAAEKSEEMKVPAKNEFSPLANSIKEVLKSIVERKNHIVTPEELERKLKKLLIYLLKAPSWPYPNNNPSIENVTQAFNNFKTCHLSIQNQTSFKKLVSQLSKHLFQQSLNLKEVTLKILTKANRASSPGLELFKRIKELLGAGTERILLDYPNAENVIMFARVFALQACIFKPNADNVQARQELKVCVDRLVELLVAYDHQNQSTTLLKITVKLMEHMVDYFKEELLSTQLASLVWTFDALVNNEQFISYMQPLGTKKENIFTLASQLFLKEQTWRIIAKFIIFLGDPKLFQKVLEKRVDINNGTCTLDQNQIDCFFLHLNKKLREDHPLFDKAYVEMYRIFLDALMRSQKLHFLRAYAKHPDNRVDLGLNLKKLDFSFMEGIAIPLELFFGNGTYRAVNERNIPHGLSVRRTLVRLFTSACENPVRNVEDFTRALTLVLTDFNRGFDLLCGEILGKVGETIGPGIEDIDGRKSLIPVERWLVNNVAIQYQSLKSYVLMCLLSQWREENFLGFDNPLNRFCWHEDKLYMVEYNAERRIILKNFFTGESLPETPRNVLVSELVEDVKDRLHQYMLIQDNQIAVSALTEAYMSFHNHDKIKKDLEKLLNFIFKKMKEEASVPFVNRVQILASFLHVMAPFFKKLNVLIENRFFTQDKLKKKIAQNLIIEADKIGERNVGESLRTLELAGEVNREVRVVQDLAQLVSPLCVKDIEEILQRCSLSLLVGITSQFENVICRKIDELSYSKEDFIRSFCSHEVNSHRIAAGELQRALGDLSIKEAVIRDYGDFLRKLPIPIHFILPNQALAIQLCVCRDFESRNILIKMGTGQGKSIVTGTTALNEARKIKDKPNGRVFVLTSYDHLAKRDHELGANFFKKDNLRSLCISKIEDVANFTSDTKIIYADIENIDTIIRKIILKLIQNQASFSEKLFIKVIYGSPNEDLRIILDEYDLLLHDLELKEPYVEGIPSGEFFNVEYVRRNHEYWPGLANDTHNPTEQKSKAKADLSSGKEYTTVQYYQHSDRSFNLLVSVTRLSNLIRRAKRVIGLSGTALQGEKHCVHEPLFFELPSSQNPEVFGTKIQEDKGKPIPEGSGITCFQKLKLDIIGKEDDLYIVSEAAIKDYCQAIVRDITTNREAKQKDSGSYQRPIMLFADPYFNYKTPQSGEIKKLWNVLKAAIQEARIPLNEITTDVSDAELQKIARSGAVTMTTIKYGRGADIRVSLDIEEGLHVIIGTPVIHIRLLLQLIGRTGRMGRKGSYSNITLGDHIMPEVAQTAPTEFYSALHELTRFFVNRLTNSAYNADVCKKWLLLIGNAYSNRFYLPKIKKAHAQRICEAYFEANVIPEKFFS